MANSKAYTWDVTTEGEIQGEHQSSPHWVLTFIRWAERDTLRTAPGKSNYASIRTPLIVENDCVSLSVSTNKGSLTPNMNATLLLTDINYLTAVAPGDFCFVNIVNWGEQAYDIVQRAHQFKPINGPSDGFKGVFKVQSVREMLVVDPNTGDKNVAYKISGYAFTEFNNTIYFNPAMVDATDQTLALFASNVGSAWSQLVTQKGLTNIQDIVVALIQMLIGTGLAKSGAADKNGVVKTPNTLFMIPSQVGLLLGVDNARAAKDIFVYLFGIQQYAGGDEADMATGMNPSNIRSKETRTLIMDKKVQGEAIQKAEYWNQVKLWSILNQFCNAPLNEMFTTFRIDPSGSVMPTMVFRQIPFTNDSFDAGGTHVTRFLNLPRWKLDPAMIFARDIGRDEAARINFVQVFGRSTLGPKGVAISAEVAAKNYLYDVDDVKRSGLRPLVISSTFDEPTANKPDFQAPRWARIIGDTLIGGHLKMNGTIQTLGIQVPIAVGDNLETDGVVFHIESVAHSCSVSPDGKKTFRTSIALSSGISVDSNSAGVAYAQMNFGNAYAYRSHDTANDGILPGISESQKTVGRKVTVDNVETKDKAFEQPNSKVSINSPYRYTPAKKKKK